MVKMRRSDRQLDEIRTMEILRKGVYGVLSTAGADGQPYGTPLSYVLMDDGKIYFHCARAGRKLDHIRHEPRISFCVVGEVQAVLGRRGDFTTLSESAIVFGRAAEVEDEAVKVKVLLALAEKYLPEHIDAAPGNVQKALPRTTVCALTIEEATGKANASA
jgi:nitroimidazol reductase NimA-like FMN-containing flavoprotein (pyridoxamine 5'-phosphate oxidase superfamily)